MASELKPCLLCEGEAKLLRRSGTAGRACPSKWYRERVECKVCGLTTREYKKPGAAAHSWNTRPAPAATDTGLETKAYVWKTKDAPWRFEETFFRSVDQCRASDEHFDHADLCLLSQAEELLAAKDKTIALAETTMIEMHQDLNKLEADNAAKDAQIKELEQINAILMGDDEDKPRYTTKRLKHEITRATEALETKLAAAEQQLQGIVTAWESLPGGRNYSTGEVQDWILGPMQKAINRIRAVLGGKPS